MDFFFINLLVLSLCLASLILVNLLRMSYLFICYCCVQYNLSFENYILTFMVRLQCHTIEFRYIMIRTKIVIFYEYHNTYNIILSVCSTKLDQNTLSQGYRIRPFYSSFTQKYRSAFYYRVDYNTFHCLSFLKYSVDVG